VENTHDLRVLLGSRHPLLFVTTNEEQWFLEIVESAAGQLDAALWMWSSTQGLRHSGEDAQYRTNELRQALDFIGEISTSAIFVLIDATPALERPETLRRLREVSQDAASGQTIIVTGTEVSIPSDLANVAHAWTLRPPDREELAAVARRTLADFHARGFPIRITRGEMRQLADSLSGMTIRSAERAIQRAVVDDGTFDARDIAAVRTAKAEILNQDGVLEIIESHAGSIDDIGGLDDLKRWLRLRKPVFQGTSNIPGLDIPKGVLLTGVPGCGKSLVAKTIAATWGVPLILLDPSRLYSK
jgi:SpoVK/Ycf46/Vps4 family AAA+-type ATPase